MRESHVVPDHHFPDGAVPAVHPRCRHRGPSVRQLARVARCPPGPFVPTDGQPVARSRLERIPPANVTQTRVTFVAYEGNEGESASSVWVFTQMHWPLSTAGARLPQMHPKARR